MKYKVAFICIHNSCRSQIAEGFANEISSDIFEVYSAGTEKYPAVKEKAVKVMEEIGVDISSQYPKLLKDIPDTIDILITMGCGVSCPYIPTKHREDWGLDDPSGGSLDDFRKTRDLIKEKVKELDKRVRRKEIPNV